MHSESRVRKYSFSMIHWSGTKHMPNVVIFIKQPGKISNLIIKFRKYNHSVAKTTYNIIEKKMQWIVIHHEDLDYWTARFLISVTGKNQSSMKLLKFSNFLMSDIIW